ncbi:tape measure protein [Paucibacter sp. TC2R-5]|uniref:tape measure protein n=1 Tax=Paucibacter sp. TC2R-5 TaxID=2893555 RepID=UPI0021E3EA44|nr:tape measure protein [Paucibacter sp. TC2R-5]MCV2359628.1 tape measure protein [Paucibacter sp. TC2R-5]
MATEVAVKLSISGTAAVNTGLNSAGASAQAFGDSAQRAGENANRGMGAASRGVQSISQQLQALEQTVKASLGFLALVGTVASLSKEANAAALAVDKMNRTLEFASGSGKAFADNSEFLRAKVRELGLDLKSAGDGFAKVAASAKNTGLEGEGVRSVFDAVAKASTVMGLSAEDTSGVLLAIGQMISKGTVASEELRGQLGERLPGAFQTAARAMGVTTGELGKMLEQGQVATDVFLPRFAAQMRTDMAGSVAAAADSVQANMNRLSSAWTGLLLALNNSPQTNETLKGLDIGLTSVSEILKSNSEAWPEWADTVARAVAVAGEGLNLVWSSARGVKREFEGIYNSGSLYLRRQAALVADSQLTGGKGRDAIKAQFDAEQAALDAGYNADIAGIYKNLGKYQGAVEAEIKARAERKVRLALFERGGGADQAARDAALLATKPVLTGGKGGGDSKPGNAFAAEQDAAKVWEKAMEEAASLTAKAIATENGWTEAQRKANEYRASAAYAINASIPGMNDAANAAFALAIAEERSAAVDHAWKEARRKATEETDKFNASLAEAAITSALSVAATVQGMQDEEQALRIVAAQHISLAQALEVVHVARLQDQADKARANGNAEQAAAIEAEIKSRRELAELTGRKDARAYLDGNIGGQVAEGFDKASQSLSAFVTGFSALIAAQEAYNKARLDAGSDATLLAQIDAKNFKAQINGYGTLAGAAKGFFNEGSKGYKTMEIAERGFRAIELGLAVQSALTKAGLIGTVATAAVAGQAVETSAVVAGETARNAAKVPGVFMSFMSALGPWGMAAAGVAIAAVLGGAFSGGGGGAAVTNTGTGTVFGDAGGKSESIAKSIEALREVDTLTMRYSAQMLQSLRAIESSIGGLTNLILRTGGLDAAAAGVQTGFKSNALGQVLAGVPLVGNLLGGLFGSKTSITGNGISAAPQSLAAIAAGGFDASYYTDTKTKDKFLGITYGSSSGSKLTPAGAELEQQLGLIFKSFADTALAAAGPLGLALGEVQSRLNGFVVDIGKIDLAGLSGAQIQEKLSAVLGAAGDNIAHAALPGLDQFQKVGEGYLQTVARVASGVEVAKDALERLGLKAVDFAAIVNKQGDVGAELLRQSVLASERIAGTGNIFQRLMGGKLSGLGEIMSVMDGTATELADTYKSLLAARTSLSQIGVKGDAVSSSLLRGAGGLEGLQSALKSFSDNFLSDAERLAGVTAGVRADFAKLGLAMPSTRTAFVDLVRGIDASSDAGRKMLGQVLALSDGFAKVADAADAAFNKLASAGQGIASFIAELLGSTAGAGLSTARATYNADLSAAQGGDADASGRVVGSAKALIEAARNAASDPVALARETSRIAVQLQALPAVVAWQVTMLQKLDVLDDNTQAGGALAKAFGTALGEIRATLQITTDSNLPDEIKRVILAREGSYAVTVSGIMAANVPDALKALLVNAETTGARSIGLSAAFAGQLSATDRAALLATDTTVSRVIQSAISVGALTQEQYLMLVQADQTVAKTVKTLLDSSALTAGERTLIDAIAGKANSSLLLSGKVDFANAPLTDAITGLALVIDRRVKIDDPTGPGTKAMTAQDLAAVAYAAEIRALRDSTERGLISIAEATQATARILARLEGPNGLITMPSI